MRWIFGSGDLPAAERWIAANGSRFHVLEAGSNDGPLVLFLHGFPEFGWAWRHQLPALAERGFRAVAMDLRGYGASDKTPRGYDPFTLAGDVTGVIRSLGHADAVLVGHGIGGQIGWAAAVLHPAPVRALAVASAPHPLTLRRGPTDRQHARTILRMLSYQMPIVPERRLVARNAALVEELLRRWSAPGSTFPDAEAGRRYRQAMLVWPAPHCALEYYRWVARSTWRADGRRFAALMREPVRQRVLQMHGALDPVLPRATAERSAEHVTGAYRWRLLDGVGHFPHEEQPEAFTKELLGWLDDLDGPRSG